MKGLTIRGTAVALGLFFDVTLLLCLVWAFVVPSRVATMAKFWEAVLPGFAWLTPWSVVLGLVELFLYAIYTAVVFVPLFNYFEGGKPDGSETATMPGMSRKATAHR
jgi:hypothetical protein